MLQFSRALDRPCRYASAGLRRQGQALTRISNDHDLVTSPAFIVMMAASEFKDKTTAINQQWQTESTTRRII
jgi:hypothetical protein